METYRTTHDVQRKADNAVVGAVIATWDDGHNLVSISRVGDVSESVLAAFRMEMTPAAFRAEEKFRFVPDCR